MAMPMKARTTLAVRCGNKPIRWPPKSEMPGGQHPSHRPLPAPFPSCRAVAAQPQASNGSSPLPEVVVKIDNESDAFATVVTVEFGDRLGELLDTVRSEGPHRVASTLTLCT
jgi:hypothetical protein